MHSISWVIGQVVARIRVQKVGGLVFVKVRYHGCYSLCVSWCVTTK